MAGSDPQKQFLTLIRGFATEKSEGERRIVNLRKRIQELRSELDAANAELEQDKRLKETTEQDLKGYEVELAMNETSIQTLEARISLIQDEVSTAGSVLEALKNEEGASRDEFIEKMFEINTKIRNFQDTIACAFQNENWIGITSNDELKRTSQLFPEAGPKRTNTEDSEVARRDLENKLAQIISQTNVEEQEYQAEQSINKQVQQELIDLERTVFLMEAVMKETKELQDLTKLTSEYEETCALLGDKLQKRCLCPSCHLDNVDALGGILQAGGGS